MRTAIASLNALVARRALDDGISRTTAWHHIFDLQRMHADIDSNDPLRRETAERALSALAVMMLRREVANATDSSLGKVRLFELASLVRRIANEQITQVFGDPGFDVDPN